MQTYKGENYNDVINKDGVVVVDFFATWCGPCKMLAPVLDELSKEDTDTSFVKIDIDEYRKQAIDAGIRAVPTLVLYKDGVELSRVSGYQPKEKLVEWLSEHK